MVTDEMVDKAARCIDPDAFAILDGGDKWRIIHSHHQREATKTKARAALEAALSAAEPVGYLFQMFYPGSKTWSADMFSDHEPTKNLPAEHMRNVRPLYAAPPAPSVAVKALEWEKQAMSHGYGLFIRLARTSIGDYQISHGAAGKYEVYLNKDPISASYDSVHEAKAVAKADFEARILSALSAQVQDVAVPEGWQLVPKEPNDNMANSGKLAHQIAHGLGENWSDQMKDVYRAMLAAAPATQEI